jgi:hypothetical protein
MRGSIQHEQVQRWAAHQTPQHAIEQEQQSLPILAFPPPEALS